MADNSNTATAMSPAPGAQRGVYWKRNDSMRLVHLLIDPDLKPAFLNLESQAHRGSMESALLNFKQFWTMAAQKFNDEEWRPPHLFPNDPHLSRCRSFTPSKKSKEIEANYLREKYKALRRQFSSSFKKWEEIGNNKIESFWKCSGAAPGTSDEGCWYMFLVLWIGKHEDVLSAVLDKGPDHPMGPSGLYKFESDGLFRGVKRQRSYMYFDDQDYSHELQQELRIESVFKQQAEVLKFADLCFRGTNEAIDEEQRAFWRQQMIIAHAQLSSVQAKLPQPHSAHQNNAEGHDHLSVI